MLELHFFSGRREEIKALMKNKKQREKKTGVLSIILPRPTDPGGADFFFHTCILSFMLSSVNTQLLNHCSREIIQPSIHEWRS
jgi:hypothetical protein